jgi:hypothetical protein
VFPALTNWLLVRRRGVFYEAGIGFLNIALNEFHASKSWKKINHTNKFVEEVLLSSLYHWPRVPYHIPPPPSLHQFPLPLSYRGQDLCFSDASRFSYSDVSSLNFAALTELHCKTICCGNRPTEAKLKQRTISKRNEIKKDKTPRATRTRMGSNCISLLPSWLVERVSSPQATPPLPFPLPFPQVLHSCSQWTTVFRMQYECFLMHKLFKETDCVLPVLYFPCITFRCYLQLSPTAFHYGSSRKWVGLKPNEAAQLPDLSTEGIGSLF